MLKLKRIAKIKIMVSCISVVTLCVGALNAPAQAQSALNKSVLRVPYYNTPSPRNYTVCTSSTMDVKTQRKCMIEYKAMARADIAYQKMERQLIIELQSGRSGTRNMLARSRFVPRYYPHSQPLTDPPTPPTPIPNPNDAPSVVQGLPTSAIVRVRRPNVMINNPNGESGTFPIAHY